MIPLERGSTALRRPEPPRRARRTFDAPTLLKVEVVLLTCIPSRLVIGPLGGVGSPAAVLGVGLFLLWAVHAMTPSLGVAQRCGPVRAALALLWATLLVSVLATHVRAVSGSELANSDRFLIQMIAVTGIVLVAAEGLRDRHEVLAVLRAAVAGVGFMALVAILQFRPGFDLTDWLAKIPLLTPNGDLTAVSTRGGFARPAGTALHPIEFGVIAGTALAFGAHLAIYDRATPRRFRLGPLVLIAFAIPISISRSALLTAGIVLIWFVAGATAPVRRRTLIALAATLSTVFMLIPGLIGTLRGFVFAGSNDSSISSRTSDFAAVASDLRASPWVGRGPGTYLPTYRILDNQYLLTLVEVGILGLIGLVAVLGVPAVLGRNARRMSTDEADRSLGQSFAGAGVALLAAAATFDALSFPTFTLLAALWVGLAGAWWAAIASTGSVSPEASRHTASRAGGR